MLLLLQIDKVGDQFGCRRPQIRMRQLSMFLVEVYGWIHMFPVKVSIHIDVSENLFLNNILKEMQ